VHWKINQAVAPKHGDTMVKVRRAWWPHCIGDVTIWLEQYETLYMYENRAVSVIVAPGVEKVFEIGGWIKITEILVKWRKA